MKKNKRRSGAFIWYNGGDRMDKKQLNEKILEMAKSFEESPEVLAEVLVFESRFYRYSLRNTLAIYNQNPGATYVQSFDAWKRAGYSVKKGEQGIKVLTPVEATVLKIGGDLVPLQHATKEQKALYKQGKIESVTETHFRLGNVFDISQTTMPVDDYPKFYTMGISSLFCGELLKGLSEYSSQKLDCKVIAGDLQSIAIRGTYTPGEIKLNKLLKDTERLSTLTHEIGHAVMEHADRELSTARKEFEADAFSIMLSSYCGCEIQETRKRHLAQHYSRLKEQEPKTNLLEVLMSVQKEYRSRLPEIEKHIGKYVDMEHIRIKGIQEGQHPSGTASQKQMDFVTDIARTLQLEAPEQADIKKVREFIGKYKEAFYKVKREEELQEIKENVRIIDYAGQLGYGVKKIGSYYTIEGMDSMRIDDNKNCFWRNSLRGDITQGSIVDFAAEYGHKGNVTEAIRELRDIYTKGDMGTVKRQTMTPEKEKEKGEFVLPAKAENMHRVYAYLTKSRFIDQDVIQDFVDRKMLYQDRRGNCVFVSYQNDKPNFGFLRGTNTNVHYFQEIENGDYEHGYYIPNNASQLIVTESAIDAMSIMTVLKGQGHDYKEYDYLVLAGTGKYACVANNLLEHPKEKLLLALDNDMAGVKGTAAILQDLQKNGIRIETTLHMPQEKDWNAELVKVARKFQSLDKIHFFQQALGDNSGTGEQQEKIEFFTQDGVTMASMVRGGETFQSEVCESSKGAAYMVSGNHMLYLQDGQTAAMYVYQYGEYCNGTKTECLERPKQEQKISWMEQIRQQELLKSKNEPCIGKQLEMGLDL